MMPLFGNFFPSDVIAFVSQCPHDFSLAANQTGLTEPQKQILSQQLGFPLTRTVNIRQVHGDRIVTVNRMSGYTPPENLPEADGIVTDTVALPIVLRTADCVPVFMYDPDRPQIALVHAGWKGTQRQIVPKALATMNADPVRVKIAFGPAVRDCCYEIGDDVRRRFPDETEGRAGRYYLDLVKANMTQARQWGAKRGNLEDCGLCVCCDERYFSYRRQGEKAGRNLSLMMLVEH